MPRIVARGGRDRPPPRLASVPMRKLAVLVLLAAAAVLGGHSRPAGGAGGSTARVERVVDGDTIVLSDGERVRYIGMDTPESVKPGTPVQCYAKAAARENERLIGGQQVRLRYDAERYDRYG